MGKRLLKKFLSWIVPDRRGVGTVGRSSLDINEGAGPTNSIASLIRFLEAKAKRVDLLSIFAKKDTESVGRISAHDFIMVCAELGAVTVTPKQAIELADRFGAAPGSDYIMYRKIMRAGLGRRY